MGGDAVWAWAGNHARSREVIVTGQRRLCRSQVGVGNSEKGPLHARREAGRACSVLGAPRRPVGQELVSKGDKDWGYRVSQQGCVLTRLWP